MKHVYKVKTGKDEGVGTFELHCCCGWLSTHRTAEEREAEMAARQQYDAAHSAFHGRPK